MTFPREVADSIEEKRNIAGACSSKPEIIQQVHHGYAVLRAESAQGLLYNVEIFIGLMLLPRIAMYLIACRQHQQHQLPTISLHFLIQSLENLQRHHPRLLPPRVALRAEDVSLGRTHTL